MGLQVSEDNIFPENKECKILILSHRNADLDAVVSSFLLKYILEKKGYVDVELGTFESISKFARAIVDTSKFKINPDPKVYDVVYVVDTSSREQINFAEVKNAIIIDHHMGVCDIDNRAILKENRTSTAEILLNICDKEGIELPENLLELSLIAIISDTGYLRTGDSKTFKRISSILEKLNKRIEHVVSISNGEKDRSEKIANLKALSRMTVKDIGAIVAITEITSFESSVMNLMLKAGADIVVVISKRKDETRLFVRASQYALNLGVNLYKVVDEMKRYCASGGGHAGAVGMIFKGKFSKEKVINVIIEVVKRQISEGV